MSLFKITIDRINDKSGTKIFDTTRIDGIDNLINHLPNLTYLGHGCQAICFKQKNTVVVKCCLKRQYFILSSGATFLSTVRTLIEKGFPILEPLNVLYEDSDWLVYTQPVCKIIEKVTIKLSYLIVRFVKQMVEHNVRISDIFYRNFGAYENKIVIYDYHDLDHFNSSSNFLITNLYTIFLHLGYHIGWTIPTDSTSKYKIAHWDQVIKNDFGRSQFPEPIVEFLCALNMRDRETSLRSCDNAIKYLYNHLPQTVSTYPLLSFNGDGVISLNYPRSIYEFIFEFIRSHPITNIFEIHAPDLGLGLKIAQDFPNLTIGLGCLTKQEFDSTSLLIENGNIFNASIIQGNLFEMELSCYDFIFYSIFTIHSLCTYGITNFLKNIKRQVHRYCCFEIPCKGDPLHTFGDQIKWLQSPHLFRSYLCQHKFKVDQCLLVDYGHRNFKRYLFVCSV